MAANGLECLIREPTRVTEQIETCIDHVLMRVANKRIVFVNASVMHVGITDHSMIRVDVHVVGEGGVEMSWTRPLPLPPSATTLITVF